MLARSTAARSRTDERAHQRGGRRRRRHLRPEATARFTRVREKEKKVKKGSSESWAMGPAAGALEAGESRRLCRRLL